MKKIIISGASGFVGSSLVRRLLNEDVHIWTLDKQYREGAIPKSEKITRLKDDPDIGELKELFEKTGYDSFYNIAWQGVNGPEKGKYEVQINNILLTLRYAELAKTLDCKKFLCAGTIAERALDSLSTIKKTSGGMLYSAAKACSHVLLETYCKNIGLNMVWMQFSNIYGPRNKTGNLISYTLEQLRKGEVASFGPAQQPYDFIFVDDLIEAICRLGIQETKENFYYIGSGKPRVLEQYLMTVGKIFGRPDLIHVGERADDGIKYDYDMMDCSRTVFDIGNYVSDTFENHIKYTIENY